MSAADEETKVQELVIIRRSISSEEAGHKGGVWKIAYADFMTAMMAFFLVMWLINASDKQTLTQVATYFNPLRLTDKVALSKGMHQSDSVSQSSEKKPASSKQQPGAGKSESKASGAKPKYTEEVLFRDPYGTLSKLASQAAEDQSQPTKGGEAYRDPFDPVFRRESQAGKREDAKQATTPPGALESAKQAATPPAAQESAKQAEAPPGALESAKQAATPPRELEGAAPGTIPKSPETKQSAEPQPPPLAPSRPAQEAQAEKVTEQVAERAKAAKLEADIKETIARAIAGALPNITVTVTEEGILISLTDDQNFGMFAIASAEPRPAMVVLMEKLGKVITAYPERLVVRGHTDGRPYKSGTYDNWRLSTARAHMAYYMLMRGGIDERRFERIEGHADRSLKIADDPEAAQNRRIEILLRKARS